MDIKTKSVMGVVVPEVSTEGSTEKDLLDRGYGVMGTSFAIDEAITGYEKVIDKILSVAEVENDMKRLLEEIDNKSLLHIHKIDLQSHQRLFDNHKRKNLPHWDAGHTMIHSHNDDRLCM